MWVRTLLLAASFGLSQLCFAQEKVEHPGIDQYAAELTTYQSAPNAWTEAYRPVYHFTPFNYWQNDPNGLAYFKGEWHFFYQHYLHELCGVSWGHATSKDLVTWTHHPPAIPADDFGAIYSGGGVVDHKDTTGFFGGKSGYVGLYTYHQPDNFESQGLAYSQDGFKFFKYDGNPIIPDLRKVESQKPDPNFRDPKVFWHEESSRWIMAVAGGTLRFFSSPDLKEWTFESINEDINTECPDLFELAVEGTNRKEWVLTLGGGGYMLGEFDGKTFTPTTGKRPTNYGVDAYATQSFDNAPNGRRIVSSWNYFWTYNGDWLGPEGNTQNIPLELSLRESGGETVLVQKPIPELKKLRGQKWEFENVQIENGSQPLPDLSAKGEALEIIATIEPGTSHSFGFILNATPEKTGTLVGYDAEKNMTFVDRTHSGWTGLIGLSGRAYAPAKLTDDGKVQLHFFLDRTSIELFSADYETFTASAILPHIGADQIRLFGNGGGAVIEKLEIYKLKSIHPTTEQKPRIDLWQNLSLRVGGSKLLRAQVHASEDPLQWSFPETALARFEELGDGWVRVTGLEAGSIDLKVTSGDQNAVCKIGVTAAQPSNVGLVAMSDAVLITANELTSKSSAVTTVVLNSAASYGRVKVTAVLQDKDASLAVLQRCSGKGQYGTGAEVAPGYYTFGSQFGLKDRETILNPWEQKQIDLEEGEIFTLDYEIGRKRTKVFLNGRLLRDVQTPAAVPSWRIPALKLKGAVKVTDVHFQPEH